MWTSGKALKCSMVCLSLGWIGGAAASPLQVTYKGPDTLTLVTRPNRAGSNVKGALFHVRHLPEGALAKALPPIVTDALQRCSMQGISAVIVEPAGAADKIGETHSRMEGLGIYLNLAASNRVMSGNWYLAPFYSFKVSLSGEGNVESSTFFEFDKIILAMDLMTEDVFLETARAEDVERTVVEFLKRRLPESLARAFPRRCPAAGANPR